MANVPVTISRAITIREGARPSNPPAFDGDPDPINQPGTGGGGVCNFKDYEPSTGNIKFDLVDCKPRKYGFSIPITGDIIFNIENSIETVLIKIRHNSSTEPTFTAPTGINLIKEFGEYQIDRDNYIYANVHKDNDGNVFSISYRVTQDQIDEFAFVFSIDTNNVVFGGSGNDTFILPLISAGEYNFTVDWGDGSSDVITQWDQAEKTHIYPKTGRYTISIKGICQGFSFNNNGERLKILNIINWGIVDFKDSISCFYNCANLQVTATDTPILGNSMFQFFMGCSVLTGNLAFNNWHVSNVTTFEACFRSCLEFNAPLNNWDVSNGVNFTRMFNTARKFNQNLNNWNLTNAVQITRMFNFAREFNGDISSWDVSGVLNFSSLFDNALEFNQPLNNWDLSNATNLTSMFNTAENFNQPLDNWDVSNVLNMNSMFRNATDFDQNIGGWDVSKVENFSNMFNNTSFNQDISLWDMGRASDTRSMFQNNSVFNQNIGGWVFTRIGNISRMFENAFSFNQNIGSWDVSTVTNISNFMLGKTDLDFSSANLDAIYNGWSLLTFNNTGLNINFGTIKYTSSAQAGKDILEGSPNNWTITDGGQV